MKRGLAIAFVLCSGTLCAAPGGSDEPVRLLTSPIDPNRHDGGLRPAIGVETIQVLRANREHPETADGYGWTYNHAAMLAYRHGRFYLEYLSNPFGENLAPGRTLLIESPDGRTWGRPRELFPVLLFRPGPIASAESGMAMMHQDMGFYTAPDGRLLALGFYGHAPAGFGAGGIGRVAREIHADGSLGPIYFVRYAVAAGGTEANTPYFPFYTRAPDPGFVAACEALLHDRLKTLQWWGEDLANDGFFPVTGHDAASVYHRSDGRAVVLWKDSWSALSNDEGQTWTPPVRLPTMQTDGAKTWGQRTADGRYAIAYVPTRDSSHRWPLALVTGDDGVVFDHQVLIDSEVAPRRYFGRSKDFGLQYVRGISEGDGEPPGRNLWLAYENDKEDLWVSRIPLPVRSAVEGPVADRWDHLPAGAPVPDWNIRRGRWTPVELVPFPDAAHPSLKLADRDPADYAVATRVFATQTGVRLSFRLYPHQARNGQLAIEVVDPQGRRPVRIALRDDGHIHAADGARDADLGLYEAGRWQRVELQIDARAGRYMVRWDDRVLLGSAAFADSATEVERIAFRTGEIRSQPTRASDRYADPDLPGAGEPVPLAAYNLQDLNVSG